jgi:hypothetical protein
MKRQSGVSAFEFVSFVSEAGYQWIRAAKIEPQTAKPSNVGWCLVPRLVPGAGARPQRPLQDHTGLFRDFSQLALEREAMLEFANEHGLLFGRSSFVLPADSRGKLRPGTRVMAGERFEDWKSAVAEMKMMSELWRAITKRDLAVLQRFVIWQEHYVGYRIPGGRQSIIANSRLDPNGFAGFEKGDLLLPSRIGLQSELNERLAGTQSTVPRLIRTANNDMQLSFCPPTLQAALWLQFAQSFASDYQIRKCRGCGKYFQVGAGATKRADATTCSDTCRQRARRKENGEGS